MSENTLLCGQHDMMPQTTHDEAAQLGYVRSLRRLITSELTPGHKAVYDARIAPQIEKELGRSAENRTELKPFLEKDGYHQTWSAMLRTTQEMMWNAVYECVDRQADDLNGKFKELSQTRGPGSLSISENFDIPAYSDLVDNHTMPGGYHTEIANDDVTPGAAYEQSIHVYMMGGMGRYNDDVGKMLSDYVQWKYPDFKPLRILDIGCSVGHSTLPYADMFPDAEIHAIDLAAPLVRFGHARAKSMNKAIHFSQQNAEATNFEDESFDLIVSHIMIHETSTKALDNIMKECRRLLKPGGLTAHLEMLPFSKKTPLQQYLTDWDSVNNHEPFIGKMNDLDMDVVLKNAGFSAEERFVEFVPIGFQNTEPTSLDYAHLIGTERHIFGAKKTN
ncbi:MAG: class I SAM-dependent methyltransferase [Erythrobacter sp.]|uniref:class I SAM-dependent methyltransferase n=1 Tax=Erythrobacter sp. TaxID=1042 RepID=UPI003299426C